jgi:chloramphenicol O-acetyltransferase type A
MATHIVDLESWPRAAQFHFFRTYEKPQYAVTSRVDVTRLIARKATGISTYRASIWAIGVGIHAVPELCMRFRGDTVVRHDLITLSMTVPRPSGSFGYAYVPHDADFASYDLTCAQLIAAAAAGDTLGANTGEVDDVAYASCLPWLDYTSMNNALPGPDDCIPRVSWGKFVDQGNRQDMAMTLEVHHALVDGEQIGAFFAAVQRALDSF